MEKKKKVKIWIISLFSVCLILSGAVFSFFFFRNKNTNQSYEQPENINKYLIAQTAIFNEDFSQNYNGIYKFERINFVKLSNLSQNTKQKIYDFYGVDGTMGLISTLTKIEKTQAIKNNEIFIIENGRFQFNHNSNPYIFGSIFGNDDLSILYDDSNNKLYNISLTNMSQDDLKNISASEKLDYSGDQIYLTKTLNIEIENNTYSIDSIYVYKIQK